MCVWGGGREGGREGGRGREGRGGEGRGGEGRGGEGRGGKDWCVCGGGGGRDEKWREGGRRSVGVHSWRLDRKGVGGGGGIGGRKGGGKG